METLKVIIRRCGVNYGATIDDERIGEAVVATHETYNGVWEAIRSALELHIESCINDGDELSAATELSGFYPSGNLNISRIIFPERTREEPQGSSRLFSPTPKILRMSMFR